MPGRGRRRILVTVHRGKTNQEGETKDVRGSFLGVGFLGVGFLGVGFLGIGLDYALGA